MLDNGLDAAEKAGVSPNISVRLKRHGRLVYLLVRDNGDGFDPLGQPTDEELARLKEAMSAAGREPGDLEMVGGTRAVFPDSEHPADLGPALETIPAQWERGFHTFCFKPSQFTDDPSRVGALCREVVSRVEALAG